MPGDLVPITPTQLFTAALEDLGVVGAGESPSSADLETCRLRFNGMLDRWKIERLTIPIVTRTVYPFVANRQTYWIGPSANAHFACDVRPVFVERVGIVSGSGSSEFEQPCDRLDRPEWADLSMKGLTSLSPTRWAYEPTSPDGSLAFWPTPDSADVSAAVYAAIPLQRVAANAVGTALTLPDGYEEALRTNLALRLCPAFGKAPSPVIAELAVQSIAAVQRENTRPKPRPVDAALLGRGRPWNVLTGGF